MTTHKIYVASRLRNVYYESVVKVLHLAGLVRMDINYKIN